MEACPKTSKEKLQFVLRSGELFKNKVTILHTKSKMRLLQFYFIFLSHQCPISSMLLISLTTRGDGDSSSVLCIVGLSQFLSLAALKMGS